MPRPSDPRRCVSIRTPFEKSTCPSQSASRTGVHSSGAWSRSVTSVAARSPTSLNERLENIGARRLHTVLTTLLEDTLYDLPDVSEKRVVFDRPRVKERLDKIVEDEDLRRYIL